MTKAEIFTQIKVHGAGFAELEFSGYGDETNQYPPAFFAALPNGDQGAEIDLDPPAGIEATDPLVKAIVDVFEDHYGSCGDGALAISGKIIFNAIDETITVEGSQDEPVDFKDDLTGKVD